MQFVVMRTMQPACIVRVILPQKGETGRCRTPDPGNNRPGVRPCTDVTRRARFSERGTSCQRATRAQGCHPARPEGTEQSEFVQPEKAVEDAGASVEVVGVETGEVQTLVDDIDQGEKLTVEKSFSEVSPDDYDALIVPGGAAGAETLRGNEEALKDPKARGYFLALGPCSSRSIT